jgi:undecaprenyl-diphosphatase
MSQGQIHVTVPMTYALDGTWTAGAQSGTCHRTGTAPRSIAAPFWRLSRVLPPRIRQVKSRWQLNHVKDLDCPFQSFDASTGDHAAAHLGFASASCGAAREPRAAHQPFVQIDETFTPRWHTRRVDWSVAHALNAYFAHHDLLEDPLSAFVAASEVLFLAMLVIAFVAMPGGARRNVQRAVVAAGLSAGLALAVGKVLSDIVDRARPFVAHPSQVHLFVAHAPDPGFPSDHATAAFAIAVAVLLRFRGWGLVLLVVATILAAGRVAIGVHYPTDVLAGAALGAAAALALWTPRLRAFVDAIADFVARRLDAVMGVARVRRTA